LILSEEDTFDAFVPSFVGLGQYPSAGSVSVHTGPSGTYVTYDAREWTSGGLGPGWPGMYDFTYIISDSTAHESVGIVNVFVSDDAADDLPWAITEGATTLEDQPVLIDVLANDLDAEGQVWLTYAGPAGGTVGTAEADYSNPSYPNGVVVYTPPANWSGGDYFGYTIRDSASQGGDAYVGVSVQPVNDPPVAAHDEIYAGKNHSVTVFPKSNDSDIDDEVLIICDVADPPNGSVTFTEDAITYTPDLDYVGVEAFVYTITDGHGASVAATVIMTVVNINLTIYDGQYGAPVSESLEETRGAFTVANLNDTDGDGVQDSADPQVDPMGSGKGVPEWDLMELRIDKPTVDRGGAVVLDVNPAHYRIRLWESATKGTEVPIDLYGEVHIPTSQLPKTVYVEALEGSTALRDMQITAAYEEIPGTIVTDTVAMTGIWATVGPVEHDTKTVTELLAQGTPWHDMPTPPRDQLYALGGFGGSGLRPVTVVYGVRNLILMRVAVQPASDQYAAYDVFFDVTQRSDGHHWVLDSQNVILKHEQKAFPISNETPNDDPADNSATDEPDSGGAMYFIDAPGWPNEPAADERWYVMRASFETFVRVGIGVGADPSGDVWSGSRASEKYEWHVRHRCENQGGQWVRTTGDAGETDANDVGPPKIDPGENP